MYLKDRIPSYLVGKTQLVASVAFSDLFAILFILVSSPYDRNSWFRLGPTALFGYTALFVLGATAVIASSRHLMYRSRLAFRMRYVHYLAWNLLEILAVCLVYTFITVHLDGLGMISIPIHGFLPVLARSFMIGLLALGVPYLICAMYFGIQDRDNTIRLMNYGSVVSDSEPTPQERKKITLFGEDGVLKLSVNMNNIFYIESDDNYIKVWYSDSGGEVKQYMLRCRLKTVEDSFAGSDLVRCHRKYIVNLLRVQVLSKERDGYCIKLDLPTAEPIPVSKTYEKTIISRFNSR